MQQVNPQKDISHLEKSVEHADSQLNLFAIKLSEVEKRFVNNSEGDELDEVCVMELLESMTEVRNEYQNLRKDIQEVQQLQKETTHRLRYQLKSMHQTFLFLKKRIELKASQN